MKLATYKDGSRDGQLVVVSADLTQAHHANGIATRMQQVLDDWNFLAPQLEDLARTLQQGKARHAFPFDPRMCMAPLPRAYRLVDAQPCADAELPGAGLAGDMNAGAQDALPFDAAETDLGAQLVVALGDVPRGAGVDQARDGVRLVMLANHWQWRVQGERVASAMAWAPVAVTLDALGRAWHRGRFALTLCAAVDGQRLAPVETAKAGAADTGGLIAQLARHRAVSAGTLLALPGPARTALNGAARVEVEAFDATGQSVFGAISQTHRTAEVSALPG
ncbi:fumarylacetoacetate hydrolase family protein [Sphaerotilus sp.]|uniref:fumarylacetoacetate hydrolase family protein n=1 Tax=Sphaerotilus sp. TaxID=2093942 RepID=UPI00286E2A84|nr:fumarylacetoacetate hydrolase family protein [Sphaerotilus sp.]